MAKRRSYHGKKPPAGGARPVGRSATQLRVRKSVADGVWELLHPRCAIDRQEDIEEVRKMIEGDEIEIAVDEVRWLLNGCSDFVEAHKTLGELALLENDISLARGHFGYAYQIGKKALAAAGCRGPLPYRLPANQAFHEAAKGLAFCLKQAGKTELLQDVLTTMAPLDPTDPLGIQAFAAEPPAEPGS